ncbi:MAG: ribonuclease HI [Pseudomonadota bacterium]
MDSKRKKVTIYTDGACSGNPGPGGWAALLMFGETKREISGGEPNTTNNRMELQATIEGLKLLKEPCDVAIFTDSKYVLQGFTEWLPGWKRKGWKTADNKPVKNVDLWQALVENAAQHKITWQWVKGHSGDKHNDRVDALAVAQAQKGKTA